MHIKAGFYVYLCNRCVQTWACCRAQPRPTAQQEGQRKRRGKHRRCPRRSASARSTPGRAPPGAAREAVAKHAWPHARAHARTPCPLMHFVKLTKRDAIMVCTAGPARGALTTMPADARKSVTDQQEGTSAPAPLGCKPRKPRKRRVVAVTFGEENGRGFPGCSDELK